MTMVASRTSMVSGADLRRDSAPVSWGVSMRKVESASKVIVDSKLDRIRREVIRAIR